MSADDKKYPEVLILKHRDAIRMRPGMFVGVGQTGLYYMADEIMIHALEHAMVGLCSTITISLLPDNELSIRDNSPGIPLVRNEESGVWLTEALFTNGDYGFPYDSRLLHWLGGCNFFSVVSALSQRLTVEISRDNRLYKQCFERGLPTTPCEVTHSLTAEKSTGTYIAFKPDPELFGDSKFDAGMFKERLQQLAYLLPGVAFVLRDERDSTGTNEIFRSDHGVQDYLETLVEGLPLVGPVFFATRNIPASERPIDNLLGRHGMKDEPSPVEVACAFQFTTQKQSMLKLFVNTIPLVDNDHIIHSGICLGISRSLDFGDRRLRLKLAGGLPRGLHIVMAIKRSSQFSGPLAKEMLPYRELEFPVAMTVFEAVTAAGGIWITYPDRQSVAAEIGQVIFGRQSGVWSSVHSLPDFR